MQSLNVDCSMFLCFLRHKCYDETNVSPTLTTLQTIAKKSQKLTRFLSGCLYFCTFCQFLQVDYYLRAENFTNTCQRARFREHRHNCRFNFTSQVAGSCEGWARNGNESTLVSSHFLWVTTPNKTRNLSKMCFLHVKVAKRDTQWTEVKALSDWLQENDMKTRLQLCPPL